MTVIARGAAVSDDQAKVALEIFGCVGGCLEAEDKVMDAVTSLNGSGPAFAYIMMEALCDGGVRMGLRRDTAMQIAAQMVQGAARMVLQYRHAPGGAQRSGDDAGGQHDRGPADPGRWPHPVGDRARG